MLSALGGLVILVAWIGLGVAWAWVLSRVLRLRNSEPRPVPTDPVPSRLVPVAEHR